MELEEGGMFDEETMPDWMRSMRGVAHRHEDMHGQAPTPPLASTPDRLDPQPLDPQPLDPQPGVPVGAVPGPESLVDTQDIPRLPSVSPLCKIKNCSNVAMHFFCKLHMKPEISDVQISDYVSVKPTNFIRQKPDLKKEYYMHNSTAQAIFSTSPLSIKRSQKSLREDFTKKINVSL